MSRQAEASARSTGSLTSRNWTTLGRRWASASSGDPALALLVVRAGAAVDGLDALARGGLAPDDERRLRAAVVVLLRATHALARAAGG